MNRPVCSYVRVLRAGRLLESPRQAARFVSLLAQERAPVLGGGTRHEQWSTMMAFLCRNKVTKTFLNVQCTKVKRSNSAQEVHRIHFFVCTSPIYLYMSVYMYTSIGKKGLMLERSEKIRWEGITPP